MISVRGNLHVHSDRSDGTLPLEKIAKAAARSQLDFVGINDHHVVCSDSRYMHKVLFLMGTEFNSQHSHYLAYSSDVSFPKQQVDSGKLVKAVKMSGGMGIIAHPFEKGSPIVSRGKHYPWLDWTITGFDGLEIWNLTSQWRDAASSYIQALGMWLFDRYKPFRSGACPKALAKWDELCNQVHVSALTGSDLHAPVIKLLGLHFKILDYSMLFSTVNNYALVDNWTGNAKVDTKQVLSALSLGKSWIAADWLSLAHGFSFFAVAGEQRAGMGEFLRFRDRYWLQVNSPNQGRILLLHNGVPIRKLENNKKLEYAGTEPGVYRVEVHLRHKNSWIPWLYSNPIYIKRE